MDKFNFDDDDDGAFNLKASPPKTMAAPPVGAVSGALGGPNNFSVGAAAVGAGRIALDGHWTSDVFLSAALGIAISKAVVYFNRKRAEERRELKARGQTKRTYRRHYFSASTRSFRWTYVF